MSNLSVLMITKDPDETIGKSITSIHNIAQEIVIIDSSAQKLPIDKYSNKIKIYTHDERDLGKKRLYGLKKCRSEWILAIDFDEIVSAPLSLEITQVIRGKNKYDGYVIPFHNHFLGKRVRHGGENYKMLRLFKKSKVVIKPSLIHEIFTLSNENIGYLKNPIRHFSYRTLSQTFKKFTDYAYREAEVRNRKGEKVTFKKLFFYPIHMFYARFIKDKGYKDGFFRVPLDLGFAYIEFLMYFILLVRPKVHLVGVKGPGRKG